MYAWFSRRIDLDAVLDDWRTTGSNFDPEQPIDGNWHVDGNDVELGPAGDDALFDAAVCALFRYAIYPHALMQVSADFLQEGRPPHPGDRILQRIHLIPGLLDVLTMNIVSSVWHEQNRRGFTLRATQKRATNGTIVVCDRAGRARPKALVISYTGRPRVAFETTRGEPYVCAD